RQSSPHLGSCGRIAPAAGVASAAARLGQQGPAGGPEAAETAAGAVDSRSMARLAVGRALLPPLLHLGGHYGWQIEQWVKEGKNAVQWTKLSCRRFKDNAARLHLFALAYNLANALRQLAL